MKLNRGENTRKNLKIGIIATVMSIVFPFVTRTFLIRVLGTEYLGLNSVFQSILQVLNLSEMGFSSAIVYSMYKPIAEEKDEEICALLNLYRKIYRYVGAIILVIGCLLIPFLPNFINGNVPKGVNIYVVYLLYLFGTVISYWLYAYKAALPNAFQRNDIISFTEVISKTVQVLIQVAFLLFYKDYYMFVLVIPFVSVLNNLMIAGVVNRIYPNYKCYGTVQPDIIASIKKKVSGLLIRNICNTSRNSVDSICISSFLGLALAGIYNNYLTVIIAVNALCSVISSSILAGVGNSIATETIADNYILLRKLDFLYMWIGGWFSACLLCLFQPFMELWMGNNNMLDDLTVAMLALYFYISCMGAMRTVFSSASGLWWENRYRALIESIANIILNISFAKLFGVHGIILATLITLFFINQIWGSNIVFKYYFKNGKYKEYLLYHMNYMLKTIIMCAITYRICALIKFDIIRCFILRGLICIFVPNLFLVLLNFKSHIYKDSFSWLFKKFGSPKNYGNESL